MKRTILLLLLTFFIISCVKKEEIKTVNLDQDTINVESLLRVNFQELDSVYTSDFKTDMHRIKILVSGWDIYIQYLKSQGYDTTIIKKYEFKHDVEDALNDIFGVPYSTYIEEYQIIEEITKDYSFQNSELMKEMDLFSFNQQQIVDSLWATSKQLRQKYRSLFKKNIEISIAKLIKNDTDGDENIVMDYIIKNRKFNYFNEFWAEIKFWENGKLIGNIMEYYIPNNRYHDTFKRIFIKDKDNEYKFLKDIELNNCTVTIEPTELEMDNKIGLPENKHFIMPDKPTGFGHYITGKHFKKFSDKFHSIMKEKGNKIRKLSFNVVLLKRNVGKFFKKQGSKEKRTF